MPFAFRKCPSTKHKANVFIFTPIYLGSCPWTGRENWRKKCYSNLLKITYLFLVKFISLFLDNFTIRWPLSALHLSATLHSSLHPHKSFPCVYAKSFCFVTHWDLPVHGYGFGAGCLSLEISAVAVQLKTLVGTLLVKVLLTYAFPKESSYLWNLDVTL